MHLLFSVLECCYSPFMLRVEVATEKPGVAGGLEGTGKELATSPCLCRLAAGPSGSLCPTPQEGCL